MFGIGSKRRNLTPVYRDSYYHDDPKNEYFLKYRQYLGGLNKTFSYMVLFALSALFIQATVAANINLNGQKVIEFGQGSTGTPACSGSTSLTITPGNSFTNGTGNTGTHYFKTINVNNVPSQCTGYDLKIRAWGISGGNPLPIYGTNQTDVIVHGVGANYVAGCGTGYSVSGTTTSGSFLVTLTVPVSLSNDVYKLTIESNAHDPSCDNSPASNGVVQDGLLLYLDAAAYSGSGNWLDQTSYNHDGTFPGGTNNPTFVSQPNNASYFNFQSTSSQYFNVSNLGTMVYGSSPRSMIGWMRVSATTGSWQWILSYGKAGTSQSMFIGFNNTVDTVYFGGYGDDVTYQKPTGNWIGQWVMMAGTYDGTSAKLYVNGSLVNTLTKSWNTIQDTNQIGRQTNGAEYTNGKISYISYYNKVLSADEMMQNFNAIKGRYGL